MKRGEGSIDKQFCRLSSFLKKGGGEGGSYIFRNVHLAPRSRRCRALDRAGVKICLGHNRSIYRFWGVATGIFR